jgi:hypothetical protein
LWSAWGQTNASSGPAIRWEIENRFRYFKRASDFREIAKAYDELTTAGNPRPSALQLEQALERKMIRAAIYDGWAAHVFEHTCGREPTHRYSSCKMENGDSYLEPSRANVIVYADNISAENCTWSIDGTVLANNVCNRAITIKDVTGHPAVLSI